MIKLQAHHLKTVICICVSFILGCSAFNSDKQYTNKVVAPNFVAELFGTTTRTISISHPEGAHISWLGFIQSNNYKYFEITKVQLGSQKIVAEGVEVNGNLFTPSSNAIVEDITINPSASQATTFANGNISVAGSSDLQITIRYSPLIAIDSETKPHESYLIINYDQPNQGSMRVQLKGYTQGVKADKCTQAVSTMTPIEYKILNSAFDLYFCSGEVGNVGQNNTPQDPSDPGFHGTQTNLASIPMPNDLVTVYQVDDETLCILTQPEKSISDFTLPIPDGLAPIDTMEIGLVEGSFAECSIDADNNVLCPGNIQIDALVSLSGFTLTNQGFTAEELVTGECPDFGAISGSGKFGDDEVTLLLSGRTLSDQNTQEYNIVDSLILAEIKLEKL